MPRKKTGAVRSKKKTVDGITFESMLEAYCYASLQLKGLDFKYEGESITLLPSFRSVDTYYKSVPKTKSLVAYGGKTQRPITYKPDFVSHTHKFYIETKGFVPSQHTFTVRWKLFLKYLMDSGMSDHAVFIPKNKSQVDEIITYLKSR